MADITIGLVEDCNNCDLRNKTNILTFNTTKSNNILFCLGAKPVMLTHEDDKKRLIYNGIHHKFDACL